MMEAAKQQAPAAGANRGRPSFTALVKERFYNDIAAGIERYAGREKEDIRPVSIRKVTVTAHDFERQQLYFDVTVNCTRSENGEERPLIMIVNACPGLRDGFRSMFIRCITPMWDGHTDDPALPDDLIPIIPKEKMDALAVRMINSLYPRAENYAVPINVDQAARKLGLKIRDVKFNSDEDILAKIFFEDATAVVTDPKTGLAGIIPVEAGTVLVNIPVRKASDDRLRNNTILHECVHWMLHRPAFLLARLWDQGYAAVACRRSGRDHAQRQWTAIDRMEWQANALAPRMLMPAWATRFVADRWLRCYRRLSPVIRTEKTIDQLTRHFNVSRQLARIRMIELGYEDAKNAFSYYDRRKHTISFENAARELVRNKRFLDTLASGVYAYVDSCFVIRDSRYIRRDQDRTLHLTPYAKAHMAECCLSFAACRMDYGMQYGMLRYNVEDETFIPGSMLPADELVKRSQNVSAILQKLPSTFSETLKVHMDRKGITCEKLAEYCLMSRNNILRFRNDIYPRISLPNVICLCIGLKLHPLLAMDLVRKAGYTFNGSNEHTAYQILLLSMTNCPLSECNGFLSQMGIKPLSMRVESDRK